MSRKVKLVFGVVIIVVIFFGLFFRFFKSVTLMSLSSAYENKHSVLNEENINIKMPGGTSTPNKDWYPFVMTFNSSKGFSNYIGKEAKLSILYNFGAFDFTTGASTFYDSSSSYFNAFYGAYVVKGKDFSYGYYEDGSPNYEEMCNIAKYDMTELVLNSLGCMKPTFDMQIEEGYSMDTLIGYENWEVIEGNLITNSPVHKEKDNLKAYIQYGPPPKQLYEGEDFPLVKMKGRFYAKYFEESGCSVFFYAIASNTKILEEWEENILQNTKLSFE